MSGHHCPGCGCHAAAAQGAPGTPSSVPTPPCGHPTTPPPPLWGGPFSAGFWGGQQTPTQGGPQHVPNMYYPPNFPMAPGPMPGFPCLQWGAFWPVMPVNAPVVAPPGVQVAATGYPAAVSPGANYPSPGSGTGGVRAAAAARSPRPRAFLVPSSQGRLSQGRSRRKRNRRPPSVTSDEDILVVEAGNSDVYSRVHLDVEPMQQSSSEAGSELPPESGPRHISCSVEGCTVTCQRHKLARHVIMGHLPWFASPTTACWLCARQFGFEKALQKHWSEAHGQHPIAINWGEHRHADLLQRMKSLLLFLGEKRSMPDLKTVYLFVRSRDVLRTLDTSIKTPPGLYEAFCRSLNLALPKEGFKINPISSPACLMHWRSLLSLLAPLGREAQDIVKAYAPERPAPPAGVAPLSEETPMEVTETEAKSVAVSESSARARPSGTIPAAAAGSATFAARDIRYVNQTAGATGGVDSPAGERAPAVRKTPAAKAPAKGPTGSTATPKKASPGKRARKDESTDSSGGPSGEPAAASSQGTSDGRPTAAQVVASTGVPGGTASASTRLAPSMPPVPHGLEKVTTLVHARKLPLGRVDKSDVGEHFLTDAHFHLDKTCLAYLLPEARLAMLEGYQAPGSAPPGANVKFGYGVACLLQSGGKPKIAINYTSIVSDPRCKLSFGAHPAQVAGKMTPAAQATVMASVINGSVLGPFSVSRLEAQVTWNFLRFHSQVTWEFSIFTPK